MKICEICGATWHRPTKYSARQWAETMFCSRRCRDLSFTQDPLSRLLAKRRIEGECWIYAGGRDEKGYGLINIRSKTHRVHRMSWKLYVGQIPDGLQVLHKCDTPPCFNPEHLFLGTNTDNVADKIAKGRGRGPRGEEAARAKLSVRDVLEIIRSGRPGRELAEKFSVGESAISAVRNGRTWKHIARS